MIVSMNFSSTKTDDGASLTICPLPTATITTRGFTEAIRTLATLRQPNLTFRYLAGYVSDFTLSALTFGHQGGLG
jgi:hypothetical protein